ncbi:MAG: hypothetical protein ABI831_12375 [Betaproteobacteria bacterium]
MNSLPAILVCDGDTGFREALRNFLFAAGYTKVDVVPTVREALAKLRHESYRCIVFGLAHSHSVERRLASVAQRRQPTAKVLFIVSADAARVVNDTALFYVIRERVFSTLLDSLAQDGNDMLANVIRTG